ncbi:hypothetical protein KIN20_038228 [Parelaphostrongylus tenuis]|uniref:Uncharacterized protein n=1 Tax=Parelaphostrongylus tenuis TaxID=148309 RepID=A0AAD5WME0_PARTN|nr:hypothetical protein KIN20_038228 [Parelaphostrongylus tenuis]
MGHAMRTFVRDYFEPNSITGNGNNMQNPKASLKYFIKKFRASISIISSFFGYQMKTMEKIEHRILICYCQKRQLSTRDAAKEPVEPKVKDL